MTLKKLKEVRAAVMVKPGVMEIRTYPYPTIDKNSAILRMEMSGICGTDKHLFKGETKQPGGDTKFPILNGHENVGTIVEIGKDAAKCMEADNKTLKEGDRVSIAVEVNCGKCWFCKNQYDGITCENQIMAYGCSTVEEPPYLRGGWAEYMYIFPKTKLFKIPEDMSTDLAVFIEEMAVAYVSHSIATQPYPAINE